jgi:tRNA modification GTPase
MLDDTIAAIATPPGRGGLAVLRVSGSLAWDIAGAIVRPLDREVLRTANHAGLAEIVASGQMLDTAIVLGFRAPRSFTGEDVVEISCHGSPLVAQQILSALFQAGARPATPGEFTMRAFLHGRLDLTQAEAVRDLVDAQTSHQVRRAQRQLCGELSLRLAPVRQRLIELIVQLESSVEFVEDYIAIKHREQLIAELVDLARQMISLGDTYRLGRLVHEGARLAIVGAPNVGKSSLFNQLVRAERAIVTPIPGTTRDLVSERVEIGGIPVRLTDTAGLRETQDVVEAIGVERTRTAAADADLVLVVFDHESTAESIESLEVATRGMRRLAIVNKLDLGGPPEQICQRLDELFGPVQRASALTGGGLAAIEEWMVGELTGGASLDGDGILVADARHHALLQMIARYLGEAAEALRGGLSEEFALVGLNGALRGLGEITGEVLVDDILDRIFSTFCIGK